MKGGALFFFNDTSATEIYTLSLHGPLPISRALTDARGARALPSCANTDPQRDSIFTKDPSNVLDHATSKMASGSKLGIDATKKLPGEGFKRPWPPLIKMDENARRKIDALFGK